ncbi:DUF7507 domain-containing protein [Arthrobacter bambusae]|uniref:DUF7507 domain-containing protein n=1 Tax=Arthrobacter bambusae TaxID=1338426 RepID=UPI0027824BFC|nr:SdrD B-like domain-containing protein [Arthrobacter bambusae]MDQ0031067.1 putative repeat protein (TIGR01451 family) [Arthrobacter bambusae]MDQ0098800.1 putative repeat protein (TIGR01451 family) [Arthrobacter bambusae]
MKTGVSDPAGVAVGAGGFPQKDWVLAVKDFWDSMFGPRPAPLYGRHMATGGRGGRRTAVLSRTMGPQALWAAVLVVVVFGVAVLSGWTPAFAATPNATATPAISITKTADGQPPFDAAAGPGNDTGANNNVVRSNQLITYQVAMSLNDPTSPSQTTFQDTTATFAPLPLGFVWDSIPIECTGPNTSLTGDGVTTPSVLVCDFGDKSTGTTWTTNPAIRALRTAVSGTTVAPTAVLSATGMVKTAVGTASGASVSISAAPKAGVTKGYPNGLGATVVNGQAATGFYWPFGIHIDDGSDIINGNSFSFTDDLSSLPAGAKFAGCAGNNFDNLPASFAYNPGGGPLAGVPGNGGATWTCTVDPSNPLLVHVTVTGVNTNPAPSSCPTLAGDTSPIPPGMCYVSTWGIVVGIPNTSLNGSTGVSATNRVSQLSATDAAGNANYGGNPDPGTGMDNNQVASNTFLIGKQHGWTSVLKGPSPGAPGFNLYKTDEFYRGQPVGSNFNTGDGYVTQSSLYQSFVAVSLGGVKDLPAGFIMCMTIDNAHDTIATTSQLPSYATVFGAPNVTAAGIWTIQYGTGGNTGLNSGDGTGWANPAAQQQGSCNTSDSPSWYSSPSQVPGGAGAVTKVRFVLNQTLTIADQVTARGTGASDVLGEIGLKVRASVPGGTVIPNYQWATGDPDAVTAANPSGTVVSTYNVADATGVRGDRVTVTGVRVLVGKSSNKAQYLAGQTTTFTLTPSSSALQASPAPLAQNIVLTDTLPSGLSYVGGSAVGSTNFSSACSTTACAPSSVTVNANGTTTLIWQLGTVAAGTGLPKISYKALISATTTAGTNYTNTVVVAADNDSSPARYRTANATININGGASFAVAKSSPTPLTQPGDPKVFNLDFQNLSPVDYASTDFVDWLPFNGDQRAPASSYGVGTVSLSGTPTVTAGTQTVTFLYSNYATNQLNMATDTDPTTMNAAIQWCTQAQFGTPGCPANFAAVTGIRLQGGTITAHSATTIQYTLSATGDSNGDLYSNQATGRVAGLGLPVSSNTATVKTVLGSISGTVWDDSTNKNGLIDNGEPDLSGTTVQLLDSSGTVIGTTTTNSSGAYSFPNLRAGIYSVHVVQPAGFTTTQPNQGTNPAVNSHIHYGTNTTAPITLTIGQNDTTENAGFVKDQPAIAIEKDLNGTHANDPNNPLLVPTGSTLNVSFKVTNTGNLALSPVSVTDDTVTNFSCPATSLAAGASMTCTGTTPAPGTPGGTHKNTATATGAPLGLDGTPLVDANGNKVPNVSATDSGYAFTPDPHLDLVKTATPTTVNNAGSTVAYSFLVTNTGNVPLTGVSVAETAFTGTGTAPVIACPATAASVAPGASVTCTATYAVTQADVDAGTVTNTAVANGTPPLNMAPVSSNPSSAVVTVQQAPAITLVKSASPSDAAHFTVGQQITYSFAVTNSGNVTLDNVGITETAFTGHGTMSATTCPVTTLAPGAQTTCTATYTITQADIDQGSITNTATAAGTPPGSTTPVVSSPSTVAVPGQQNPALSLVKSATPATVNTAGDTVSYSFLVSNTGNVTLTNVTVSEAAFSGTGGTPAVTCPVTTLAPGQFTSCTASYAATQADIDAGTVTNTATAAATAPDDAAVASDPSSATVTAQQTASIALVKTATPAQVNNAGDTVTYSFAVTNTGNTTLTNVAVTETAFSGTGTAPVIACPNGAASLAPGATVTCTATYQATQADVDTGVVTNTATAQGTPPGSTAPVVSAPSSATVTIPAAPAVSLVKSATPSTVHNAGDAVSYSFLVTNTGNTTLANVSVAETAFSGTGTAPVVVCPAGASSLAPGASVPCTASYLVTQADVDAGTVTNTATAQGAALNTATPVVSAPSSATVVIPPVPGISVVKSVSPSDAAHFTVGQQLTYTFVAANTGNTTLTNVTVTDTGFTGHGVLSVLSCPADTGAGITLAPGEQLTCTATYTIIQADVDAGSIANDATAHGTPPGSATPVDSPKSHVQIPADQAPALSLKKTADRASVAKAGETVTYSFLVTNTGNVTVTGIGIREDSFNGTGKIATAVCPDGAAALAPGASVTCTASYPVTQADLDSGVPLVNTAAATGKTTTGAGVVSNKSIATVITPGAPVADPPGATVETGGYLIQTPSTQPWWALAAGAFAAGLILAVGALATARRRKDQR